MNYAKLAAVLLLGACGTVKKSTYTNVKASDSSYAFSRDTSYKSAQSELSDDFSAKDVDIIVWYDSGAVIRRQSTCAAAIDTTAFAAFEEGSSPGRKVDQYARLIQNAITAAGTPAKLVIHVGSLSDSSGRTTSVSAGDGHMKTQMDISATESVTTKATTCTQWPLWVWLLIGMAVLYLGYRALKKFQIIKI